MDFTELMRLAGGHVEARLTQTALELAIFDALESSAATAEAVANRLKLEPMATELLLNFGVLGTATQTRGIFSLTEAAAKYLLKSSPQYLGAMIRFESSLWSCWEKLPRPFAPANRFVPEHVPRRSHGNRDLHRSNGLSGQARGDAEVVANAIDWSGMTELLDIGSGPASYPIAFCERFPNLHAKIFDLPGTLAITERYVREAGMTERIRLIAGDYRKDPIPGDYNVIFLSNIIHGESFEINRSLIRKLVSNLKLGGQIVVKDHILDDSLTSPACGRHL